MVNDTYDNIKTQWLSIRLISFKAIIYMTVKIRPQRLWVCVFKSLNILENVLEPQVLLLIAKFYIYIVVLCALCFHVRFKSDFLNLFSSLSPLPLPIFRRGPTQCL